MICHETPLWNSNTLLAWLMLGNGDRRFQSSAESSLGERASAAPTTANARRLTTPDEQRIAVRQRRVRGGMVLDNGARLPRRVSCGSIVNKLLLEVPF